MHLEDEFGDIVRKAREGRGLDLGDVAGRAGLDVGQLASLEACESLPRREHSDALAGVLGLDGEALWQIATGAYRPMVQGELPQLAIHTLTFEAMGSHGYLLHDRPSGDTFLVDPGGSRWEILAVMQRKGWRLRAILITHGHSDHVGGLEDLLHEVDVPVYAHPSECRTKNLIPVTGSGDIVIGRTRVSVMHSPGHTPNGLTFVLGGAAAVGDTLFAGSLGRAHRAPGSYDRLLASARQILSLPGETWLLPGHGPLTTVGLERRSNPFVADQVRSAPS